jgi:type IV secretory pathway VirJ component
MTSDDLAVVRVSPMYRFILFLSLFTATAAFAATLPLVEVPATHGSSDTLVVFVSGDGGWAKIDKSVSAALAAAGMPVVGLNSLQYFWTKRTPESASRDLQSVIDTYLARWQKSRVLLVGYSRGADVLPAMTARLDLQTRSRVRLLALLSPSQKAEFEFHVTDWMRDSGRGLLVRPELERVMTRTICIAGEDDKDSLCRGPALANVQVVILKGAHHFDGGYDKLAHIILEALR